MITNKRVLLRLGTVSPKVISLEFSMISSAHLQMKGPRIGHINLNSGGHHVFDSVYLWQPGASWAIVGGLVVTISSFRYIRDPEKVYDMLRSLLADRKQP